MKSDTAKVAREGLKLGEGMIDDAAHGLEQMFMLTLPIFDAQQYRKIEDDVYDTIDKGAKALEKAKNLEQAMNAGDTVKTFHQLKSFITGFNGVLDSASKLNSRSLALRTGAMPRAAVLKYEHAEGTIYAYDFIVDEWQELGLHAWAERVAADAKKLLR